MDGGQEARHRQRDRPAPALAGELGPHLAHEAAEEIGPGQDHGDRVAAEREAPLARRVEERLHLVRELLEDREIDDADVALLDRRPRVDEQQQHDGADDDPGNGGG